MFDCYALMRAEDDRFGGNALPAHAIKFIVQDMGNGVDRVVSASLIPVDEAEVEATHQDWVPLNSPHPARYFSLGAAAAASLGADPSGATPYDCTGFVRTLSDRMVEIICWTTGGSGGI